MQSIKVILDRFFDDSVILITESGKQILWPKDKLPEDFAPGQVFYLTLTNKQLDDNIKSSKKEPVQDPKILAKTILEEILNGSEQEKLE